MQQINFEDLKNKVAVITGGGGVIGATLARSLANSGVHTAILDLNKDSADKLASEIRTDSVKAIGLEANVLSEESLQKAAAEIRNQLGKIDILINCAGGNSPKATTKNEFLDKDNLDDLESSFFGLDITAFQKVFDLNFIGTLLPTQVLTTDMIHSQKGVVINISSMNSFRPLTKIPAYSAAKSSINNFTQWLAVHLSKVNIRVNAIAPGFFLTNQNKFLLIDEKTEELTPRGDKIIQHTPMGKFGQPEDLCGTLLYLISDVSSFVTGIVVPVDGGFSAYSGV